MKIGSNYYNQSFQGISSKVIQSLAWLVLAVLALPTVVGSYMAMQKAVHIWSKSEVATTTKVDQIASSVNLGRNQLEAALGRWVEEASKDEDRMTAKQRILDFSASSQETCLKLSNLGLTSLPNIFNDPCFHRLEKLFLINNQLKTLPDTIGHLKGLGWLELHHNELVTLPKEIGKLRKLKILNLHHNQLKDLPKEIGKLLMLEWLILNHNKLVIVPEEIGNLSKLKTLNLHHNQLESLPQAVGKLIVLEWLDMEDNLLKTIPFTIGDLPALEWLNLKNNRLDSLQLKTSNPTFLEIAKSLTEKTYKLPALKWLNLENNSLKSLPDEIGDLQALEWLNLSRNELTVLPSAFNKLKNLKTLNLSRNKLAYLLDKFDMLQTLKILDLSHNQLERLPYTFKGLQALEWLNASHNKLNGFHLENFQIDSKGFKRLPVLKWLNLSHNKFTQVPPKIGKLLKLEKLNLSHNQLEKTLPREIGKLLLLKELDLSHNYIKSLPDELGSLVALKELYLNHNDIENLPHTMGALRVIEKLHIGHNKLKTLTYAIGKLESLKELDVSYNQLIALRGTISDLKALEWLNLGFNSGLRILPITKITKLSNKCEVDLTGCKLFLKVQLELNERTHRPNYAGPFIIHSTDQEDVKPIKACLTYLYGLIHKNSVELPNLEETPELLSWLNQTSNFNIAQQEKEAFASKIISFLEHANENQEFREVFYAIVKDASKTLGDNVAISTLNLGLAYKLSITAPSDIRALADFLKGVWAINILGQIARDKVPTFPVFDKTEVSLESPNKLREELGLSVDVQDMLYFTCSALKQEDMQEAKKLVLNKLSDQEAYFEFLINNGKWQEALGLRYPQEFAVMQSKKSKASDKSNLTKESGAIIKREFDQKLKELTRKAL